MVQLIILEAFYVLKARVVAPVTYGQRYVGHQNMCTACFLFFFCLPILLCHRHVKGVYWVRCLVGGYLYVCCEFGVIHVRQMTCRDASGFWSREGDEGLSRVREQLYRLFAIIVAEFCFWKFMLKKAYNSVGNFMCS